MIPAPLRSPAPMPARVLITILTPDERHILAHLLRGERPIISPDSPGEGRSAPRDFLRAQDLIAFSPAGAALTPRGRLAAALILAEDAEAEAMPVFSTASEVAP